MKDSRQPAKNQGEGRRTGCLCLLPVPASHMILSRLLAQPRPHLKPQRPAAHPMSPFVVPHPQPQHINMSFQWLNLEMGRPQCQSSHNPSVAILSALPSRSIHNPPAFQSYSACGGGGPRSAFARPPGLSALPLLIHSPPGSQRGHHKNKSGWCPSCSTLCCGSLVPSGQSLRSPCSLL